MNKSLSLSLVALALASTLAVPAGAVLIESGSFVSDTDDYIPAPNNAVPGPDRSNVLVNPGFETGSLPPWVSTGYAVTSADAQSGIYSVESFGNVYVEQSFAPIAVGDVNSITLWCKQPEGIAFEAVDFLYDDNTLDEFLIAPGVDWTFHDVTSQLRAVGSLVGVRVWGYSGGGPAEDLTRVDDVTVDADVAVPTEESTWGRVKQLYR